MIAALLLCWMAIAGFATYGVQVFWRNVARKPTAPAASGVAVLIPIKGAPGQEAALGRFLEGCMAQQGASYRVVFAVEGSADPAAGPISALAAQDPRVSLVVAGRAASRGQKVHNQLAALAALGPHDRFIVFADADVILAPDWLTQLLRPLVLGRADLASGYRWMLPADRRMGSRFCALMDWSVATVGRSRRWNLCWGGSMAVSAAALDRINLPEAWSNALLDDIVLTRAARRVGIRVHAPHQVLVPSPVRHDLGSLFEFGRRQYLLVRVHAPGHWWFAGAVLLVPAAGGAVALWAAARGSLLALGCLLAALGLQQLRAGLRVGIARRVLLPEQARQSAGLMARDRVLLPVAHLLHLAIWLTSAAGRTMTWAGTRYRLTGFAQVEVIGRDA